LTAVAATTERVRTLGPGEVAVLLCLLLIAVHTCSPRWAWLCAVLTGGATVVVPLRFHDVIAKEDALLFALPLALLTGVFAGLGGYLRSLDHRRGVAVTETRRAERLAMAADLHDFVAHHVTGILVQTQMARMMAATERDRLDPVLAGIEQAATQALDSMRLTVGILRDGPEETAQTEPGENRPVGNLTALVELVEGFGGPTGPKAQLHRDASLPRNLPHEVQAAAYRVVQEALTNVRRHAADATEVTVALAHAHDTLRVTVRDNGRGGAPMPYAARGGGFGIVGLTERVTALDGTLHTGPRKDHGWEVLVEPLSRLLTDSVSRYPERTAIVLGGDRITYAELDTAVNRVANLFVARGVQPGYKGGAFVPEHAALHHHLLRVSQGRRRRRAARRVAEGPGGRLSPRRLRREGVLRLCAMGQAGARETAVRASVVPPFRP
jgi:hypothetical protein